MTGAIAASVPATTTAIIFAGLQGMTSVWTRTRTATSIIIHILICRIAPVTGRLSVMVNAMLITITRREHIKRALVCLHGFFSENTMA